MNNKAAKKPRNSTGAASAFAASPLSLRFVVVSSLLLALLLLLPFLATIPGLHGDEAWAGVRAHEIAQGMRPIIGMNWYTGSLYDYLLCPGLAVLGYHVFALRLFTVGNSLLCVVLYFLLARRLFGERIAALAALALVSLPAFTAYGRPAYEVFALNPVLAVGALLLLVEGNRKSQRLLWLFSGICLGLGTWNHVIFLAVPAALLTAAFSTKGLSLFRCRALYLVAYGFLLALTPRLFYEVASSPAAAFAQNDAAHSLSQVVQRAKEWPALLVQMVHGYPTFRRFTGQVTFHSPDLVWPILLAGLAAHLKRRGPRWGIAGWQLFVFTVTLFAATLLLCPRNSDRYFLLGTLCGAAVHRLRVQRVLRVGPGPPLGRPGVLRIPLPAGDANRVQLLPPAAQDPRPRHRVPVGQRTRDQQQLYPDRRPL